MPVEPVTNGAPASEPPEDSASPESAGPLPVPELDNGVPEDALSRLLLALETQNQESLKINTHEISAARERLKDLQEELAAQLKKALEAAKKEKKEEGGWFSKTFGGLVDEVAKIVGKAIEVLRDVIVVPADMTVSFAKNLDDRQALMTALRSDLHEFREASGTETSVTGFLAGTAKFSGDLLAFETVLLAALAENAVKGEPLADAVRAKAAELWHSFETNILENPDFWTVSEKLVKLVAVAAALVSCGTLAPLAVALLIVLEADNRYGFIEDTFGKEATPWVRLGIGLAAAAMTGGSSDVSSTLGILQLCAAVLSGVGQSYQGYREIKESDRRADEIDRHADVQETLHVIQENQRLIETLLELYEEKSKHRTHIVEQGVRLGETQGDTERALVLPA